MFLNLRIDIYMYEGGRYSYWLNALWQLLDLPRDAQLEIVGLDFILESNCEL